MGLLKEKRDTEEEEEEEPSQDFSCSAASRNHDYNSNFNALKRKVVSLVSSSTTSMTTQDCSRNNGGNGGGYSGRSSSGRSFPFLLGRDRGTKLPPSVKEGVEAAAEEEEEQNCTWNDKMRVEEEDTEEPVRGHDGDEEIGMRSRTGTTRKRKGIKGFFGLFST